MINEQSIKNYLKEVKAAYNKTLVLEKKFTNLHAAYLKELEGQKEKRSLNGKISSNIVNFMSKKLTRSYLINIFEINMFLNQAEAIYDNMPYCPNKHDAKKACEQSSKLLIKFAYMLEDLYDYTCSLYNIENSNINSNEITK